MQPKKAKQFPENDSKAEKLYQLVIEGKWKERDLELSEGGRLIQSS